MKRWLYVLVPLFLLATLIAWRLNVEKSEAAAVAQKGGAGKKRPQPVAAVPVEVRDLSQSFSAVGTVESPLKAQIAPKVTGRIEFLQVREGDRVAQGQVLARIDNTQVEAEVREERANLAEAQSRLAQAQITLNPTTVGIQEQIREREAALASARADYNQANQNLAAQIAAAQAGVSEAQSRINSAEAEIGNAEAEVRSAQANLENVQASHRRLNALLSKGYVSKQEVEDALTDVKVRESGVDVARGRLNAARAQRNAAISQKRAQEKQAQIVATKGKADVEAARARMSQAQAALRTARANTAQTSAFRQNLAALRSAVSAAEASLRSAESRRADTVLRSPIDGVVTDRLMDPGSLAGPGQPILTVQSLRQLWFTVPVPEEITRSIRVGQGAQVEFDAYPNRTFISRVSRINPAADPQSRQFLVRLTLDNEQSLIKPGMFGRVTLVTDQVPDALVVPREAVEEGPDGASVVVVDENGQTERREVTLGASDPRGFQVTEGLRRGEKVVILSAAPLRGGETVSTGKKKGGSKKGPPG